MKYLAYFFFTLLSAGAWAQTDNIGSGRTIDFDGTNDYINYGNVYHNLNLPLTISAWVYLDPTSGASPIFTTNDNPTVYRGFWFFVSPTSLRCEFGDGTGGNDPAFIRGKVASIQNVIGRWVHVCAVMTTPLVIDLYVNGINVGGNSSGGSLLPMASSISGDIAKSGSYSANGVTNWFNGKIDELRIWNRSLSQDEIRQGMCKRLKGNESGLIGYWTFDETTGNTEYDKSSSGLDGQIVGGRKAFSGAPIGDDSKYQYSSDWTGATFSFQDNDNVVSVNNIQGSPEGIHIYEVKNLPSQRGGLNANTIDQSYFGVFAASLDADNSFDVTFAFQGINSCKLNLRKDNSVANWSSSSIPTINIVQQTEIIKNKAQNLSFTLGNDQTLCDLKPLMLTPFADPAGLTFTWQNNSHESTFLVSDYGKYWVAVTDGCAQYADTITFNKPIKEIGFVPNVITPNGDAFNQYFRLDDSLKGKISLLVLNRWGKEVFKSASYENDWDGGSLSPGVYYIILTAPCIEIRDWLMIMH